MSSTRPTLRPPRPEDFTSQLRSPAVAARVGLVLGLCFGVCFVTGLVSHYSQLPDPPFPVPTSPSWGYRLTQGLHVTTGAAAVPLLLVKLWSVLPHLFAALPRRDPRRMLLTGLERGSVALLVSTAIFQLATGIANAAQWYPWSHFSFRTAHFALAWVAIGALLVHIAVKLPVIRDALRADIDDTVHDRPGADRPGALSRRALVRTALAASGVVVLANVGSTLPWLRRVSVFAVRSGEGPQGVPVNKSAQAAGVADLALDPAYALRVLREGREVAALSLEDLRALPQHSSHLPIACVEGWSAAGTWSGVRVRDVLRAAGLEVETDVVVTSLQPRGPYRRTVLPQQFAVDDRTLLALDLSGEPLVLDHGFPCRVIAPNRPGVLQTKWVQSLEVST